MANSPQSAKRARQAERRRLRGQSLRSQFRTAAKKTRAAAQTDDPEAARKNFRAFQTIADRLADRGVVHHNTVSRLKSRINADLKKARERAAHAKEQAARSAQAAEEQAAAETVGAAKAPKTAVRQAKTAPAATQKGESKTAESADKPEKAESGEVKADSPDSPPAQTDGAESEKA